jgi:hypothetical protein
MSGREGPQEYYLVSRAVGGVGERIGRGGGSTRIILHARSFLESLCCRSFSSPRPAPATSATPTLHICLPTMAYAAMVVCTHC